MDTSSNQFLVHKWFLDFTGADGETFIFYIAKLKWRGITVPYTSYLWYNPASGMHQESRLHGINWPQQKDWFIVWEDSKFKISGIWEAQAPPIKARLFDSEEGGLDWNCHHPIAQTSLKFQGRTIYGLGYAEYLELSIAPWKIPMDQLRWGRFCSEQDYLVWIKLSGSEEKQWLWCNGKQIDLAVIKDHQIILPNQDILLEMDRSVALESEKKIQEVVKKLLRFLPGLKHSMPLQFLMADEFKWRSRAHLNKDESKDGDGWAIHELVDFKPKLP